MKETLRTEVEELFLEDMVVEDAKFLLLGDDGEDVDAVISNTRTELFGSDDSVSSDMLMNDEMDYEDDDIDDDDED